MSTVNKAILVGRLGKDPEIRYLPTSTPVVTFSIATDHKKKEEERSETTWHAVVYFGRTAEIVGKRAKKGDQVYAEGRMTQREYTDRQSVKHRVHEVTADRVILLAAAHADELPLEPAPAAPPTGAKEVAAAVAKKNIKQPTFDDLDNDIPF